MMTKRKITSMKALRREKKRLALQIEQEKADLVNEVETLKENLWPFQVFRRFRRTAESVSENKFFVIGAQLAYSILNATWKRKKSAEGKAHDEDGSIADFLKQVAKNFLENFLGKEKAGEEESATP